MEYDQINQLYLDYLGRPASSQELEFYARRFGSDVDRNETLKFIQGGVKSGEISQERANELKAPLGINYEATDFMAGQLADQYAKQREFGYRYQEEGDLQNIFYGQAAKLSANGLTSIYDVGEKDGVLINKVTGKPIEKIGLKGNWTEDPTSINIGPDIQLEDRGKFKRWGFDTSVEGMAHYGLDFQDGVPVFTPYYKDTSTKIFGMNLEDVAKLAIAGTALYFGGQYLLAEGGAAAGASTGAAAGAGEAAGTAIVGTPGVSTIYPVAAPSVGVSTLAPQVAGAATGISLLEGAQFPVEGLQATASNVPSTAASFGTTTAAEGLAIPTTPGLSAMDGAQGLLVPVEGGTISQLGLVPTGAVPALGPDGLFSTSLVNDPDVLGNAVFSTDSLVLPTTVGGGISAMSALQAAGALSSLLGQPELPLVSGGGGGGGGGQARGVDFSPLYRNTIVGLLPGAERYRRSLL